MLDAGAVQGMAGGEVVRAVEYDVGVQDEFRHGLAVEPLLQREDLDFGIDGAKRGASRIRLRRADRVAAVENLALQVGEIDLVAVGESDASDAACREIECGRAAQAAGADDQRARSAQLLLPLDPDFREEDVAAVTEKLLIVQFSLSAGLLPCATAGGWPLTGWPLRWASAWAS